MLLSEENSYSFKKMFLWHFSCFEHWCGINRELHRRKWEEVTSLEKVDFISDIRQSGPLWHGKYFRSCGENRAKKGKKGPKVTQNTTLGHRLYFLL